MTRKISASPWYFQFGSQTSWRSEKIPMIIEYDNGSLQTYVSITHLRTLVGDDKCKFWIEGSSSSDDIVNCSPQNGNVYKSAAFCRGRHYVECRLGSDPDMFSAESKSYVAWHNLGNEVKACCLTPGRRIHLTVRGTQVIVEHYALHWAAVAAYTIDSRTPHVTHEE